MGVLHFFYCRGQIPTSHIGGVAKQDTFRGRTAVDERFVIDSPGGSREALAERRSALSRDLLGTHGEGVQTPRSFLRRKPASNAQQRTRNQPAAHKKQRLPELAIGVVLVVGGALGAAWLNGNGNQQVTVVASAQALEAGHVIAVPDLVAKNVSTDVAQYFITAAEAKNLIGRTLSASVDASEPLSEKFLLPPRPLLADEILVPLKLNSGDFPPDLYPGNIVRIALTPDPGISTKVETEAYKNTVEVWSLHPPTDLETNYVVTLRAKQDLLIPAAEAGKVKLVVVSK